MKRWAARNVMLYLGDIEFEAEDAEAAAKKAIVFLRELAAEEVDTFLQEQGIEEVSS